MEPRHLLASGVATAAAVGSSAAASRDLNITLKVGRARVETDELGGRAVTVPVAGRMDGLGPVAGRWVKAINSAVPDLPQDLLRLRTAHGSFSIFPPHINDDGTLPERPNGPIDWNSSVLTTRGIGLFADRHYRANLSIHVVPATHRVDAMTIHLTRAYVH